MNPRNFWWKNGFYNLWWVFSHFSTGFQLDVARVSTSAPVSLPEAPSPSFLLPKKTRINPTRSVACCTQFPVLWILSWTAFFFFLPSKSLLKFWGILDSIWGRLDVEKAGAEIKWGKYSQLKIGIWSETSFPLSKIQCRLKIFYGSILPIWMSYDFSNDGKNKEKMKLKKKLDRKGGDNYMEWSYNKDE